MKKGQIICHTILADLKKINLRIHQANPEIE